MSVARHFLFPLLFFALSPLCHADEDFHCGIDSIQHNLAHTVVKFNCKDRVSAINGCCVEHDQCYDRQTGRSGCDDAFCACVKGAGAANPLCGFYTGVFCDTAKIFGEGAYKKATEKKEREAKENEQKEKEAREALQRRATEEAKKAQSTPSDDKDSVDKKEGSGADVSVGAATTNAPPSTVTAQGEHPTGIPPSRIKWRRKNTNNWNRTPVSKRRPLVELKDTRVTEQPKFKFVEVITITAPIITTTTQSTTTTTTSPPSISPTLTTTVPSTTPSSNIMSPEQMQTVLETFQSLLHKEEEKEQKQKDEKKDDVKVSSPTLQKMGDDSDLMESTADEEETRLEALLREATKQLEESQKRVNELLTDQRLRLERMEKERKIREKLERERRERERREEEEKRQRREEKRRARLLKQRQVIDEYLAKAEQLEEKRMKVQSLEDATTEATNSLDESRSDDDLNEEIRAQFSLEEEIAATHTTSPTPDTTTTLPLTTLTAEKEAHHPLPPTSDEEEIVRRELQEFEEFKRWKATKSKVFH